MLRRAAPMAERLDVEAVLRPVAQYQTVGLAVSGGVDSLALMILAARWKAQVPSGPRLIVYSLDHGLRAAAGAEVLFVQQVAQNLGLAVRLLRWDGEKPKSGLQAAARAARYRLIGDAMAQDSAEILLTAHHLQDQAETVLMRMAHGSGLTGLGGMRAFSQVEDVPLFRPLLDVPRDILVALVEGAGLTPVQDPSNTDMNYERVRWRNMRAPFEALGLDGAAIGRFAQRAQRADLALQTICDAQFDRLAEIDDLGVLRFLHEKLMDQPLEIQLRLLQKALGLVGGDSKPFALQQIERLGSDLSHADSFQSVTLCGCYIALEKHCVVICREAGRVGQKSMEIAPGAELIWDNRFELLNNSADVVTVCAGTQLSKRQAAEILQRQDFAARHVHGAPLIADQSGEFMALGAHENDHGIIVRPIGRKDCD